MQPGERQGISTIADAKWMVVLCLLAVLPRSHQELEWAWYNLPCSRMAVLENLSATQAVQRFTIGSDLRVSQKFNQRLELVVVKISIIRGVNFAPIE